MPIDIAIPGQHVPFSDNVKSVTIAQEWHRYLNTLGQALGGNNNLLQTTVQVDMRGGETPTLSLYNGFLYYGFPHDSDQHVYGSFVLPANTLEKSNVACVVGLLGASTGNVRVGMQVRMFKQDGAVGETANTETTVAVADTAKVQVVEFAGATGGHGAPGSVCVVRFSRLGTHTADTNTGTLFLAVCAATVSNVRGV
jgi:hypothetical protein